MTSSLPAQCVYTPFDSGYYAFSVGLTPLGKDFGNGVADGHLFQFDDRFGVYQANKQSLRDSLQLYAGTTDSYTPDIASASCEAIARSLIERHPARFRLTEKSDEYMLNCLLTGDELRFDLDWLLLDDTRYVSALEALAPQIQEDIAVVHAPEPGADRLVACHVCAPSGWDPSEKLGKSFNEIHDPVPEMDSINAASVEMLHRLTRAGANQRFVWSVTFDEQLNRLPAKINAENRAPFDPKTGELFARVERQIVYGLPQVSSFLFTIRPYIYPVRVMSPNLQDTLKKAVLSQSPAMLKYKGIENSIEAFIEWFDRNA